MKPLASIYACLIGIALTAYFSTVSSAAPTILLETTSETGDFVGGGVPRRYTERDGTLYVDTTSYSTPGRVDYVDFILERIPPNFDRSFTLTVSTRALGFQLKPGRYDGAERAAFAGTGKPGLDISQESASCNAITGWFDIREVRFSLTNELTYLDMTFEQHCEGRVPALRGRFAYDANGNPISFAVPPIEVPSVSTAGLLIVSTLLLVVAARMKRKLPVSA